MITSNDLFDIYYSFLLIRNDIKYELNIQILDQISKVVLNKCDEENSIRKGIANINSLDLNTWQFVFCNNVYTFRKLVKNRKILVIISKMCQVLKKLIESKSFEQAHDFVDAIHFVPIIVEKREKISLNLIKKLTKNYRKKWGMIDWD